MATYRLKSKLYGEFDGNEKKKDGILGTGITGGQVLMGLAAAKGIGALGRRGYLGAPIAQKWNTSKAVSLQAAGKDASKYLNRASKYGTAEANITGQIKTSQTQAAVTHANNQIDAIEQLHTTKKNKNSLTAGVIDNLKLNV